MNFNVKISFSEDEKELYFDFTENEIDRMLELFRSILDNCENVPAHIDIRCGNEEALYEFERPLPFE